MRLELKIVYGIYRYDSHLDLLRDSKLGNSSIVTQKLAISNPVKDNRRILAHRKQLKRSRQSIRLDFLNQWH